MFSHPNSAIYVFDYSAVHLMPEVRDALKKEDYVLFIIGADIAEFTQVTDTYLHKQINVKYREIEKAKRSEKLVQTPNEIPSSNRSKMMQMLH